mmetsp:Transcript_25428/g.38634  ORF Transcript_25428/g.38634 Transcript_25428/m.38634 type:complete len:186 (+) Transcript_25428:3-560(+)|eukprot:CAMPEP_0206465374 /NCGR_PEP_ID=MMETSP0324_2-20121206/27790_1 /ASSEMBLY_ACC=CAM_ASM_000836 /TAXON_ID=2866 /ORGANISM="Crypthecodinium cohnii, Strain Seligo" /LENGTH=185 /DNA_ID=CAMNT_0053938217 /DNA_START=100 /DNA_END=657 /DNA_ORIENTATION=-
MPLNFGENPHDDIAETLFTEEQLAAKCKELGAQITEDYRGKKPLFVGVLNGAAHFMSDLVRCVHLPCMIDFISVSSYGLGSTSGELKFRKDVNTDLTDRHVIVVEDIVDTGRTLKAIAEAFADRGAASVEVCSLLDKKAHRKVDVEVKYCGFDCPDEFVVGYGIDYAEHYRNLPYVGALKRSVYE